MPAAAPASLSPPLLFTALLAPFAPASFFPGVDEALLSAFPGVAFTAVAFAAGVLAALAAGVAT